MSKMKKLIALVTLLLFVFTTYTFNVSAAGTFSDVDPSHQYAEAIQKLFDDKIVDGYLAEDGTRTFMPENTITRAEFAKLLAVSLVPAQVTLAATPTGFPDVDKDEKISWAIPYIAYAVQQKIVSGYPDGTFQPFKEVTYAEAVKMVVCALGYGPQVENTDPWYEGYLKMGRNVGALDNALSDANTPSKRGLVAQLIMNLNKVQDRNASLPIVIPGTGEGAAGNDATIVLPDEDEDIYDGFGQITAVFDTTLSGKAEGLTRTQIKINNEKYELDSSLNYETFVSYLGYECDFEYKEENRKNVIKKITIRNDYTIYEFKDDSNVDNVTDSVIEFYKNESDSRTTKIDLTNVRIVYNGYGVEGISVSEKAALLNPQNNTVKLLDNASDRRADVAFVEGFKIYFVGGVALDTSIVTDKYRKNPNGTFESIVLNEDTNVTFKTDSGAEASISTLAKDKTTISVFGPYSNNGYSYPGVETYTNVIVSKKTIKGIVEGYDSTTKKYTIKTTSGTKEYKVSPYYTDVACLYPEQKIDVGDNATYYLDHLGRITYVSVIDSSRYGYITSVEEPDRASKNEYIINMVTNATDGAQAPSAFTLKDTVTINGMEYSFDQVFPRLKLSADLINNKTGNLTPPQDPTDPNYASDLQRYDEQQRLLSIAQYSQPIIFKTTLDGGTIIRDIKTIDISNPGESEPIEYGNGKIDDVYDNPTRRYYSSNIFRLTEQSSSATFLQMRFSSTASTKVFVVPTDRSDDEDYAVYTKSSEVSKYFTAGNTYLVEGFDVASKIPGILVVYGATPLIIDGKTPAYIVHSKIDKQNLVEKEDAYEFTMYELGKKSPSPTIEITLNDSIGADINPGDIIKFAKRGNSIGAIEKVFVNGELYDPFNGADVEGTQTIHQGTDFRIDEKAGDTSKYYTSFAGTVYMSDNESVLQLIPGFNTGLDEESPTYENDVNAWEDETHVPALGSYTISASSTYVYIYDGKENSANRIKFVNPQSVQSVINHGASQASEVFMYRLSGGYIRCIVVYKNVDFIN